MVHAIVRRFYLLAVRIFLIIFTRTEVIGLENVPPVGSGPLVIVANHFSYFEVPLLATRLPQMPTLFGAAELAENPIIGLGMTAFRDRVIPVRRGIVDRQALKAAIDQLRHNRWVAIFPEGGITAESISLAQGGFSTNGLTDSYSRLSASLLPARPGAAFMALAARAQVLPISFLGTEKIEGNLHRFKRTRVVMRIGRPFGLPRVPEGLRGREKREFVDRLGDEMMQAVARLLPVENRGIYS